MSNSLKPALLIDFIAKTEQTRYDFETSTENEITRGEGICVILAWTWLSIKHSTRTS